MGGTKNTTSNLDDVQTSDQVANSLNTAFKEDTKTENILLNLYPNIIDTIKLENEADVNNLGVAADKVLLVGQTTVAENGYYIQGSGKQTLSQGSNFFIDSNGKTAVYNDRATNGSVTFTQVFFDNINLWYVKTQASTNAINDVNIPLRPNVPCIVDTEILGYHTADYSRMFHGTYRRTIYYDGTNYYNGGVLESKIKRTNVTFALPVIDFIITDDDRKISITPGDAQETKWFIKGKVSF